MSSSNQCLMNESLDTRHFMDGACSTKMHVGQVFYRFLFWTYFNSLFAVRSPALPPTNGAFNMTNLNVYQSPATLKCDEGVNLKDNTTKTKCQANGTWTRPLPSAEGDGE